MSASNRPSSSPSSGGGDAFQLQMEVADLRKRIQVLDGGGERRELLDLLKERDEEIGVKNRQLDMLNAKFRQITEGLQKIEVERQELRSSYTKLEKEKGSVERHLDIREREVMKIAQRCAALEEKIQESIPLRVAHTKLVKEKDALVGQVATMKEQLAELEPVQTELAASRDAANDAHNQMKKLEEESKAKSDALRANISTQQDEKKSYEEKIADLEASIQSINAERDHDRKEHKTAIDQLNQGLQRSKDETNVVNKRLEEHTATISSMKQSHSEALAKLEADHATLLAEAESRSDANEKTLRAEIAKLRGALSSSNSKADQLASELNAQTKAKDDLVKQHQEERDARNATEAELQQKLRSNTVEISTLKSSLADSSDSVKALSGEIDILQGKIKTLEEDISDKSSVEEQLFRMRSTVEQLREENSKKEEEHAEEVSNLEQDLEEAWRAKAETEKGMGAKVQSIKEEMSLLEKNLAENTNNYQSMIDSMQSEVGTLKDSIETLVRQNTKAEEKHERDIKDLQSAHQTRVQSLEKEKDALEKSCQDALEENRSLVKSLGDNVTSKIAEIAKLRAEIDDLQAYQTKELASKDRQIRELKDEVSSLQSTISTLKKKNADAEMAAAEIVAELETKIKAKSAESLVFKERFATTKKDYDSMQAASKSLQARLKATQSDLKRMQSEATRVEIEYVATENELNETRSQVSSLQAEVDELKFSLGRARNQITTDDSTIKKMQTLLNDRTKLLGDMVKQNREVESDLEEARNLVTELQEESEQSLQRKESSELERDHLRREMKENKRQYAETINQERQLRDDVENELSAARSELDGYRIDFKSIDELTKENLALKDKIRRQEAYLKRKLEKEKVSRTSSLKGAPAPRASSRYSNGSTSIGRTAGSRAPLSEVIYDTAEYTSLGSHTDELDDILQDDV